LKVTPDGILSLVAGGNRSGFSGDGGPARDATLSFNTGLAMDGQGNLYVADSSNHRIRRINPQGTITTVAGNGVAAFSGDGGPATDASLNNPMAVAVDGDGNVYVADSYNQRVRRIGADGIVTTVVGNGKYTGDIAEGTLATDGSIGTPDGLAFDAHGVLHIAAGGRIRKVLPDGTILTVVGGDVLARGIEDGLYATRVTGRSPLVFDGSGNLFVSGSMQVLRVSAATGRVLIYAGVSRTPGGFAGDGGPARAALLSTLTGLAVDSAGNLYIATGNRVRRVSSMSSVDLDRVGGLRPIHASDGMAVSRFGFTITPVR
jgi:hypothetical protein